jgi:hypothetical protein
MSTDDIMPNPNPKMNGIVVFKEGKALKKGKMLTTKRTGKKRKKPYDWLSEQEVDEYIKSLKEKIIDDPKVANVLLKYEELKKKYSEVSANKAAELDMQKFIKHGKK